MNLQPFTAAYHNTLVPDIPGNSAVSSVMSGYPENVLSGGKKRSSRKKRSRSSRRNPEEKVVRGARFQSRPSASHYYNTLNHPVGYKISYRPRKGGKYIMHELALRKNGTPFWKALEKLPKRSKKSRKGRKGRKTKKSRTTRRNSRGQQVRTRRARYLDRRGYGGATPADPLQLRVLDLENTLLSSQHGSAADWARLKTTREHLIRKMKSTISHNHFTSGGEELGWKTMVAVSPMMDPGWIKLNLGGYQRELTTPERELLTAWMRNPGPCPEGCIKEYEVNGLKVTNGLPRSIKAEEDLYHNLWMTYQ